MSPVLLVLTFVFGCMLFIQPLMDYRRLFFSREIRIKFLHATFTARTRALSLFQRQSNLSASYRAFEELVQLHDPPLFLYSDSNMAEIMQFRATTNKLFQSLYPQLNKKTCKIQPITLKSNDQEVLLYSIRNGDMADWTNHEQRVLLYIHGGGFVSGDIDTYAGYECFLSREYRMPIIHIEYTLSPEGTLLSSIDDVVTTYMTLLKIDPQIYRRIIGMGDSSGGLLWLRLIQTIVEQKQPVPRGLVLLSPWVDLSLVDIELDSTACKKCVLISSQLAFNLTEHLFYIDENLTGYARLLERRKQLKEGNPKEHSFEGFPPLCVTVGTEELFLYDSMILEERILKNNGTIILEKGYGLMHTYPMYHMWSPEAKCGQKKIDAFIQGL